MIAQAALAPSRQHLIGDLAGQLGHMVELGVEGADPGGRRSELDDQVLDLRTPAYAPRPCPSRASRARVEAQQLPAPRRDDLVDLRRRVGRHGDLDRHDRLEQHRRALRHALAHGDAPGRLKAMSEKSTE